MTFAAIAADRFGVITHPKILSVELRLQDITEQRNPLIRLCTSPVKPKL